MSLSGQCLCGAVRFTADGVETAHQACHCRMCRRWSGGPLFATSADAVRFEGAENLSRYASSDWAERGFCKQCGSHLFYYLKPAEHYHLCVGALDDDSAFELAEEIWIDQKPEGYAFAGNLPQLTEAEVLAKFGSEP